MLIDKGTEYQISKSDMVNFNSAERFTVTRFSGNTVQFVLENGKGHGAMPLDHLNYLLKRDRLSLKLNSPLLEDVDSNEEKLG